jgi:hypothetical protein
MLSSLLARLFPDKVMMTENFGKLGENKNRSKKLYSKPLTIDFLGLIFILFCWLALG